jgi:6-phosphogluconolactonase/glucosamine-6-phosphate isomerase/deaminase
MKTIQRRFAGYLREKLIRRVAIRDFFEIDGNAEDIDLFRRKYIHKLDLAEPQLSFLGIGENGHLGTATGSPTVCQVSRSLRLTHRDS